MSAYIKRFLTNVAIMALFGIGFWGMISAFHLVEKSLGQWWYWLAFLSVPTSMIGYVILASIAIQISKGGKT